MTSAPTPKIKLTVEQLRAIAALTPGAPWYRLQDALRPIGRELLVHRLAAAHERMLDAAGLVADIEKARYVNVNADPKAPPLPLDIQRHQAACKYHEATQADYAAAWARIQVLIDRATELLRGRPLPPQPVTAS